MMIRHLALASVLALCGANQAAADWSGWFAPKKPAKKTSVTGTKKTTTKKPVTRTSASEKKAKSSPLGGMFHSHKIADGAKAMFTPKKPAGKNKADVRTASRATYNKRTDEKPSLLKSLFVEEEPAPPSSVGEWMSLPRLDP